MGVGNREQLGDRQKTRQLNSVSNDSCPLQARVGDGSWAQHSPTVMEFTFQTQLGTEKGRQRQGRVRERVLVTQVRRFATPWIVAR